MKVVSSHFGATRNPMVVTWPGHIADPGGLRTQFQYVTDVAPTIYQVAGIRFPDVVYGMKQTPMTGSSFAATFQNPDAPGSHPVQYFQIAGNRAIYDHGWVAAARHEVPWDLESSGHDFSEDRWELYHVADDFSEAHDLASQYPEKLEELKWKFDQEARRNDVYPIVTIDTRRVLSGAFRTPSPGDGKSLFHFFAGQKRIPNYVLPGLRGRSHTIEAKVAIPAGGARGILLAAGSRDGGFAWFIDNGKLIYDNNYNGQHEVISSTGTLPTGRTVALKFEYQHHAGGSDIGRLYVDGTEVGSGALDHFVGIPTNQFLEIGEQEQNPTSEHYQPPFRFTGKIEQLTLELNES